MAEQVELEIVTTADSTSVSKLSSTMDNLRKVAYDVEKAFGYVKQAYNATVAVAQEYDQQVRDTMLATGGTAEETSKLIQVLDDLGVEYGTLKTALKIASKQGIEPNIESLARLSDAYLKLETPVERNQFLMKTFGRSGLDMARALEQGGASIRAMADSMEGGLILTQDNIAASEEYRKNVDNLSDAMKGLQVSIGNTAIPALNKYLEYNEKIQEVSKNTDLNFLEKQAQGFKLMWDYLTGAKNALTDVDSATRSYTAYALAATKAVEDNSEAEAENAKALEESKRVREETIKIIDGMNSAQLSATSAMQSNADSFNQKYQQINADMNLSDDERKAKLAELAAEHDKDTKKIILGMLEQRLAQGGLTTEELNFLLQKGQAWGIYSDTVVAEAKAAMAEVDALANKINGIPASRTFTLTVAQQGTISDFYSNMNMGGRGASGRATGGSVTAGTPYIVGERGQELFVPNQSGTIVPNNKLGGGSNININIVTPALIGSEGAARDALLPILRAGVRQLQSEGLLPL